MGYLASKIRASSLANPEQWLVDFFAGGSATAAGVRVNEKTALHNSAVFACTRVLAETVAQIPLPVYRRLQPRGRERAMDHPLYELLHNQPNPEMNSFTFRETLTGHLALWGNAYAEIEYGRNGYPVALWPLRPDRVVVERDPETKRVVYYVTLPEGQRVTLSKEKVFHIPGLGFDGIKGYSVVHMAREAIGLGLAVEEFGARFFGNGTNPLGVLEHPGKVSDNARENMRKSWEELYSGLSNAHRVAILEEGVKYQRIGIPPEDAQFLETRKFQITDVARWFRMQPHMIGDLEKATFSNIEHQSLEFVMFTMGPWFGRWEAAINTQLVPREQRRIIYAEFLVSGLLRGDLKSRYEAYAIARQNGWLSANDIREKENENPIPGGDVYMVNGNMVPVDQAGATNGGDNGNA
ncbi:MAG: phage portal protein [Betaproteobacteria bacterium]